MLVWLLIRPLSHSSSLKRFCTASKHHPHILGQRRVDLLHLRLVPRIMAGMDQDDSYCGMYKTGHAGCDAPVGLWEMTSGLSPYSALSLVR